MLAVLRTTSVFEPDCSDNQSPRRWVFFAAASTRIVVALEFVNTNARLLRPVGRVRGVCVSVFRLLLTLSARSLKCAAAVASCNSALML